MPLLATDAYRFALGQSLSEAAQSVCLISAYVTCAGIEWVLERLPDRPLDIRVIARWRCADLTSKASDIEVYPLLRSRGARLYAHPDVHAKLALVDKQELFVGSANLTSAGLQLVPGGNREICVPLVATSEDLAIIENLFEEAVEISPGLYDEMIAFMRQIEARSKSIESLMEWPGPIANRLVKLPLRLWVAELFWSSSPAELLEQAQSNDDIEEAARHDLSLLGFDWNANRANSIADVGDRFRQSRAWRWLEGKLLDRPAHEIYFGELSAVLHDLLLDDPRPYRKDVKGLITNLLNWAAELSEGRLVLDRPAHSQRVRLLRP